MKMEGTLPWTKSCVVCGEHNPRGFQLHARLREGRVTLHYRVRDTDVGYRDYMHGGMLGTLLDEAMAWAAIVAARRLCVTAELSLRLHKPVKVGQQIQICGWPESHGPRRVRTAGVVLHADGTEAATAQARYVPMPGEVASSCLADFVPSAESIEPARLLGADAGRADQSRV